MGDEDLMVQDQLGSLVSLSYLIFSEGQPKWFPFVLLPSVPGVVWAVLFPVPFLLMMCTLIGSQLCWWSLGPLEGSWGAHMGIVFSSPRLLRVGWRATTRRASCLLIFWSFLNFLHGTPWELVLEAEQFSIGTYSQFWSFLWMPGVVWDMK